MSRINIDNTLFECNRIELSHFGELRDVEVDTFVFLLGENEYITEDSDFVFYNSKCRGDYDGIKPYDKSKYTNRRVWKNSTMPMSSDCAIFIDENNEEWGDWEYDWQLDVVYLDLDKIKNDIDSIVISLVVYQSSNLHLTFGKDTIIRVEMKNIEDRKTLYSRYLLSNIADDNIYITCKFKRNDNIWDFSIIDKSYNGGVQKLIDMFVETPD